MALALVRCSIEADQGGTPHARARVSLVKLGWGEVMHCCLWFRSVFRVRGPWPKSYGYHLSIIIIFHVRPFCVSMEVVCVIVVIYYFIIITVVTLLLLLLVIIFNFITVFTLLLLLLDIILLSLLYLLYYYYC